MQRPWSVTPGLIPGAGVGSQLQTQPPPLATPEHLSEKISAEREPGKELVAPGQNNPNTVHLAPALSTNSMQLVAESSSKQAFQAEPLLLSTRSATNDATWPAASSTYPRDQHPLRVLYFDNSRAAPQQAALAMSAASLSDRGEETPAAAATAAHAFASGDVAPIQALALPHRLSAQRSENQSSQCSCGRCMASHEASSPLAMSNMPTRQHSRQCWPPQLSGGELTLSFDCPLTTDRSVPASDCTFLDGHVVLRACSLCTDRECTGACATPAQIPWPAADAFAEIAAVAAAAQCGTVEELEASIPVRIHEAD